ncbi:hypothetical protein [Dawidia cretensis]|uniref:hypothetical protein n=1 Tax=Dawidia cretensis TaxID=2782350 RepID=UPI0034DB4FF6
MVKRYFVIEIEVKIVIMLAGNRALQNVCAVSSNALLNLRIVVYKTVCRIRRFQQNRTLFRFGHQEDVIVRFDNAIRNVEVIQQQCVQRSARQAVVSTLIQQIRKRTIRRVMSEIFLVGFRKKITHKRLLALEVIALGFQLVNKGRKFSRRRDYLLVRSTIKLYIVHHVFFNRKGLRPLGKCQNRHEEKQHKSPHITPVLNLC